MRRFLNYPLFAFATCFIACLQGVDTPSSEGPDAIRFGTSFGFCGGYCESEIRVEPGKLSFTASGTRQNLPEIKAEIDLPDSSWKALLTAFDSATFHGLDSVLGCPDCADGGKEWIEIQGAGSARKVAYEARKSLPGLEEFQLRLRSLVVRGWDASLCDLAGHGDSLNILRVINIHFEERRFGMMDHEAAALEVKAYLQGHACVDGVEILQGLLKSEPPQKSMRVTFRRAQGAWVVPFSFLIDMEGHLLFRLALP